MKIQILGSGCQKCKITEEIVKRAVQKLGVKAEVGHVYDARQIMSYGVTMTPAIAIDGEVKIEGRIPTEEEIEGIIRRVK